MLLVPFGIGGIAYLVIALVLGALFLGVGAWGLIKRSAGNRWARGLFITSIVYLTGLFVALTIVG
jgi:protoheme IX farnesyltransferase